MKEEYIKIITLIEKINNLFLEDIKNELQNLEIYDIDQNQAFVIYKMGKKLMPIKDLMNAGYFLGANPSYLVKKMIKNGYIVMGAHVYDQRSKLIHVSKKGEDLIDNLDKIFEEDSDDIFPLHSVIPSLKIIEKMLNKLRCDIIPKLNVINRNLS